MSDLEFGLTITAVGMGIVFGVLALLWALLVAIGFTNREQRAKAKPQNEFDPRAIAAITIAVVLHRAARRRQAAPEMRSASPGSQMYASRWVAAGRTRQTHGWQRGR
jgi:Na+-transporting methylmalonyl-CoA/oxaloacetate decarboxylase gamma subunit